MPVSVERRPITLSLSPLEAILIFEVLQKRVRPNDDDEKVGALVETGVLRKLEKFKRKYPETLAKIERELALKREEEEILGRR